MKESGAFDPIEIEKDKPPIKVIAGELIDKIKDLEDSYRALVIEIEFLMQERNTGVSRIKKLEEAQTKLNKIFDGMHYNHGNYPI